MKDIITAINSLPAGEMLVPTNTGGVHNATLTTNDLKQLATGYAALQEKVAEYEAMIRDVVSEFGRCGIIRLDKKGETCLGVYHSVTVTNGQGYGDPLLSRIRNREDLCAGCRLTFKAKSLQEEQKP